MFIILFVKFVVVFVVAFLIAKVIDSKAGISEDLMCKDDDHSGYKTLMHWLSSFIIAFIIATIFTLSFKFIIGTIILMGIITFLVKSAARKSFGE